MSHTGTPPLLSSLTTCFQFCQLGFRLSRLPSPAFPCNALPPGFPVKAPGFKPVFHPFIVQFPVSQVQPQVQPLQCWPQTFLYRHLGGDARPPPAARPTKPAERGVSIPAAFGGGGVSRETPPQWPARSARERPALSGRGRPGPAPAPPRPPRAETAPAWPPGRQPLLHVRRHSLAAEPGRGGCSGSHLLGELRISARQGGPGSGRPSRRPPAFRVPGKLSPEPAAPGSPPPEPRPPAPSWELRAASREPPGPGASPLAL